MIPAPDLVARFAHDLEALTGHKPRLALAVSGGPDSLALLLLAAAAYPGGVAAATVDHGLRTEAVAESDDVARLCAALRVPHETLPAIVQADGHGLQAAARHARYAALGSWMAREGLTTLLTAHHADDQAETLLMRLARGSGVAGLAGIRARLPFPVAGLGAHVCRPLLGWRRAELAGIVADAGIAPADDPTNRDERHDRARVRRYLRESPWLDPLAISRSAAALAQAEDALELTADDLFAARVTRDADTLTMTPGGLTAEFLRRLVARCLRSFAPAAALRGEQLTTLVAALVRGNAVTLAGVRCTGGDVWRFALAPPRANERVASG